LKPQVFSTSLLSAQPDFLDGTYKFGFRESFLSIVVFCQGRRSSYVITHDRVRSHREGTEVSDTPLVMCQSPVPLKIKWIYSPRFTLSPFVTLGFGGVPSRDNEVSPGRTQTNTQPNHLNPHTQKHTPTQTKPPQTQNPKNPTPHPKPPPHPYKTTNTPPPNPNHHHPPTHQHPPHTNPHQPNPTTTPPKPHPPPPPTPTPIPQTPTTPPPPHPPPPPPPKTPHPTKNPKPHPPPPPPPNPHAPHFPLSSSFLVFRMDFLRLHFLFFYGSQFL